MSCCCVRDFSMKVILTADVYKHGVAGEVVDVADGFARNYLIPKNLAMKATPGALKSLEAMRATAEARRAALDNRLNELARQINGVELFFGRRASPTGKLFGSVTTTDIAEALNEKTGIDINRRRISGSLPREVGTHMVPVRIGTEISPELKITIVREEEFASFMQKRAEEEAAAAAAAEAGEVVAEAEAEVAAEADVEAESADSADAAAE
ncbi:50S ribosomal protein L9 [Anaerolineae bacterium CFX9]|nr:50S ribosomal protein L9 [Anaerolineae bacterium CFX9]